MTSRRIIRSPEDDVTPGYGLHTNGKPEIFSVERVEDRHEPAQINLGPNVEDIDLRFTRQEGPGYANGHYQKPGAKLEDGGPKLGLRPGYGLRPVVTIVIMVELVVQGKNS